MMKRGDLMRLINVCPECGQQLINKGMQCACGWVIANNRYDLRKDFQCSWYPNKCCQKNDINTARINMNICYCEQYASYIEE